MPYVLQWNLHGLSRQRIGNHRDLDSSHRAAKVPGSAHTHVTTFQRGARQRSHDSLDEGEGVGQRGRIVLLASQQLAMGRN